MPFRRLKDYELAPLSDEELIEYAVAAREDGDPDAMRDALAILVFRRFDDLVRRARMKVPAEDAEDVASQAISDAVVAKFKGESVGEFMKLVGTILARRVADFHDKRSRTVDTSPLPEENEGDEDVHGSAAGVSPDETSGVDAQDIVDSQVAALSPSHRRVVELYVLDGWAAEEAAAKVNEEFTDLDPPMSVDNVHKIASRFRKELRQALEESD